MEHVLAIYPETTFVEIAVFNGEQILFQQKMEHPCTDMQVGGRDYDPNPYWLDSIQETFCQNSFHRESLDAVVTVGALLRPLAHGTYRLDDHMLEELRRVEREGHPCNLGCFVAEAVSKQQGIPAYIVDPIFLDEMELEARASGFPEIPRACAPVSFQSKIIARMAAEELGKPYDELNLVVAQLGRIISISAHQRGRMIDSSNSLEEGPFSLENCGGLPVWSLVELCYSRKYSKEQIHQKLLGEGGMSAYLGTKNICEAEKRVHEYDSQARAVLKAMAYQVAKEIGAMSVVLHGSVDKIILTGEITESQLVVDVVSARTRFIAPIVIVTKMNIFPMLVAGGLSVLRNDRALPAY
jgi:butyrate kinase